MRFSKLVPLVLLLASPGLPADSPTPADKAPQPSRQLLGPAYPIEGTVSFHTSLLHWLDSLAYLDGPGFTGGKTKEAHRLEYVRTHGEPTSKDVSMLDQFRAARLAYARKPSGGDRDGLTLAFFRATSLDAALDDARALLDDDAAVAFAQALRHFEPRYRAVWRGGQIPKDFLARSEASRLRDELAEFLGDVARFFGVEPKRLPPPRLVLAPVPDGHGTHAQAIGPFLLIEVRRGESLVDEVAPIVHENAHFLFYSIEPSRLDALEQAGLEAGPGAANAWQLLKEALPTAIAQGVADQRFRHNRWSMRRPWYHTEAVDAYAKRIFPLVKSALHNGGTFDEAFVRKALARYGSREPWTIRQSP